MGSPLKNLAISAVALFASHGILSAPGVRPWLFSHLGKLLFYATYSLVSLAAAAAFIWAYTDSEPGFALYEPIPGARPAALVLMPLVLLLIVGRITTRAGETEAPLAPTGIYRVCRHPGSFGLLLWALVHLGNAIQGRNVVAFVTMVAIAGAALAKNEWFRRSAAREGRSTYLGETSILPFLAIAKGRQQFVGPEIGWPRTILAIGLYGLILWSHPLILGVDPLAPYR